MRANPFEGGWKGEPETRWLRYPMAILGLYESYDSFAVATRIQARDGFEQVALAIDLSPPWAPVLFAFSLFLALQMAVSSIMVAKAMEYSLLLGGAMLPCLILLNTPLHASEPTGWGWLFAFLCLVWIAGWVVIIWAWSKMCRPNADADVAV